MTVPFQTPDKTILNMLLKMGQVCLHLTARCLWKWPKLLKKIIKNCRARERAASKIKPNLNILNLLNSNPSPTFIPNSGWPLLASSCFCCFFSFFFNLFWLRWLVSLYFQSGFDGPLFSSHFTVSPTCYPSASSSLPSTISSTLSLGFYAATFHYSIRSD